MKKDHALAHFINEWTVSWKHLIFHIIGYSAGGLWACLFIFKVPFGLNAVLGSTLVPILISIFAYRIKMKWIALDEAEASMDSA